MARTGDYEIVTRYLATGEGWKTGGETLIGFTYEEAAREASKAAKYLDVAYGDSHFWTVDLYDHPRRETGSYFQLFHGRLS